MSVRLDRVGEELRSAIAQAVLVDFGDEGLAMVSITAVQVSPGLENARVFWNWIAAEDSPRAVERAANTLEQLSPKIRALIARRVHLRIVPTLTFIFDETLERGRRIDALLASVLPAEEGDK